MYLGGVNREGSIAFNFSGEIADVKMYNSALSDQQI
ncbi:sialidase domain-containing protein [Enterococcus cecorum]